MMNNYFKSLSSTKELNWILNIKINNLKLLMCIVFILLVIPVKSQSDSNYTYIPAKLYSELELHQVLQFNEGISIYNLSGKINSVRTIQIDRLGIKYNRKYYFKKDKTVERIIEYDNNNIVKVDISYYSRGTYHVPFLRKHGFKDYGKTKFISEIDTFSKIIVSKETFEGNLLSLDTIYYEGDFKPTLIQSYYKNLNKNESQFIEYNQKSGRIELSLTISSSESFHGYKYFYNKDNKYEYCTRIKKAKLDPLKYELEDRKLDYVVWEKDGFTCYRESHYLIPAGFKDTVTFDYNTMIHKIRKKGGFTEITKFSEDYKPIYQELYHKRHQEPLIGNYNYNDYGDLNSIVFLGNDERNVARTVYYEYKYDSLNNWIERKEFRKGELYRTIQRIIEYY